jgi:hypothetical protein
MFYLKELLIQIITIKPSIPISTLLLSLFLHDDVTVTCLDCLRDLKRVLRRDDKTTDKLVFRLLGKWNFVETDLIPIMQHCFTSVDEVHGFNTKSLRLLDAVGNRRYFHLIYC